MPEDASAIIRRLDGGLVLRRANPGDADRLAEFDGGIHGDDPNDAKAVSEWVRDLLTAPHPTFCPNDFLLVEDPATRKIVSSMNTISQTWSYEGISFGVGRPELVGTDPNFRNRGLVRTQFAIVHEWSRQRGELIQVITGIPYYYRQFGYEMAIDLGGGWVGYEAQLPVLKEGQEEKYNFRHVQEKDIPWLDKMYQQECQRSLVSAVRDVPVWRNELFEKREDNVNRVEIRVIETRGGFPVGYLIFPWYTWGTTQAASHFELADGVSYAEVTPAVIRYLWETGQKNAAQRQKKLKGFGLYFGANHPAYQAVPERLVKQRSPYAFYVRVPDLPAFVRRISPVLEKRLAGSVCVGYSGELKISFYRAGLRMEFESGKIKVVESWHPKVKEDEGGSAFPNLTFLQILFGYRSLAEVQYAYPDCWVEDESSLLLEALFPKKPSSVWPIS